MWLINTSTIQLTYFPSCDDVFGGYVILSHVWSKPRGPGGARRTHKPEQSFQDLKGLTGIGEVPPPPSPPLSSHRNNRPRAVDPPPGVSSKILECCRFARAIGYDWVWIDTCCIDKTSSAELSEAINSMFTWYDQSCLCVAYLEDVPDGDRPEAKRSAFRKSEWFSRGWTLQELLAPRCVLFLSHGWERLGTKATLAPVIQNITRIDVDVLTFHRALSDVSVGDRMSWASRRECTRVEDRAYSLMGLFGVNMPTIYGEGAKAFRRLQEEIMRTCPDQTLFAWGLPWYDKHSSTPREWFGDSILASAPEAFSAPSSASLLSSEELPSAAICLLNALASQEIGHFLPSSPPPSTPTFTMTAHGVLAHIPIITGDPSTRTAVAVLACTSQGRYVGLVLRRSASPNRSPHYAPELCPYYDEDGFTRDSPKSASCRLFLVDCNRRPSATREEVGFGAHETLHLAWADIYITGNPLAEPSPSHHVPCPYFPPWVVAHVERYGFALDLLESESSLRGPMVRLRHQTDGYQCIWGEHGWPLQADPGEMAVCTANFPHVSRPGEGFCVTVEVVLSGAGEKREYRFRAGVAFRNLTLVSQADGDRGELSDVITWEGRARRFGDEERNVQLAASLWPMGPSFGREIMFDIELGGTVYSQFWASRSEVER